MVDLSGHEAGNGGYSQRKPTAHRVSSTRKLVLSPYSYLARRNYEMGFAQQCCLVGSVQICVIGDGVQGKGSPSPASAIQKLGVVGFRLLFRADSAAHTVRMVADEVFCRLPKDRSRQKASCGYEFYRQTRDVLNQNLELRDALCFLNEYSDEVWNKAVKRAQL